MSEGLLIGIVGPPKTGKSTFINSGSVLGKTVVACAPPTERLTYSPEVEITRFHDWDWEPWRVDGSGFVATAWNDFLKWLDEQVADKDVRVIGIDTGSTILQLAQHAMLKIARKPDFDDRGDYVIYRRYVDSFCDKVMKAAEIGGKIVVVNFHETLRESSGAGDAPRRVAVKSRGEVVDYKTIWEQRRLPAILGSAREDISRYFTVWGYSYVNVDTRTPKYLLRITPDKLSAGGSRIKLNAKDLAAVPNDLGILLEGTEYA